MLEIPALAEVLMAHSASTYPDYIECEPRCGWKSPHCDVMDPRTAHALHVAEAYREARTIRDINTFRALPVGALAKASNGLIIFQTSTGPWVDPASNHDEFPALVVWTPRDEPSR